MKFILTIFSLMIAVISIIAIINLSKIKTPMISLPKWAQHNTFGELPIVEVMDDGDFYEKDGAEYLREQNKIEEGRRIKEEADINYLDCLERAERKCDWHIAKCLEPRAIKCQEKFIKSMKKLAVKHSFRMTSWTCFVRFADEKLGKTSAWPPDCWQLR